MLHSQLFFKQECPVCGRAMRVQIELFGKSVACGHCHAVTVARDDTYEPRFGPAPFKQVSRRQPLQVAVRQS